MVVCQTFKIPSWLIDAGHQETVILEVVNRYKVTISALFLATDGDITSSSRTSLVGHVVL